MYQLTVKAALEYVRKSIDELMSNEELGMLIDPDAIDLHRLVEGFIVEAVYKTYSLAPITSLEGKQAVAGEDYSFDISNSVATISMLSPIARLLSLKCSDSDIILSEMIPEDSAEGRKQLNKYIRGTYDDPRLVLQKKWQGDHMPRMKYYTTKEEESDDITFDIEYLPYPELVEGVVKIAPRTEYAVLNQVVAMVLDSIRESEQAEKFRVKSKEYLAS